MKQIQISVATDVQRMTSPEIAEVTGKKHCDVMRDIRNMEPAWTKVCGRKFALTSRMVVQPAEDCFTMTQVAEEFGLEARDLCSFLTDRGIIAWRGGRYRLQHRFQNRGYEDERGFRTREYNGRIYNDISVFKCEFPSVV